MAIEIIGTGRAVPSRRVSNDDLAARIDTSDEWIRSHTGIGNRHIADDHTATSDLALEAAKNALAMAAGFSGGSGSEEWNRVVAEAAQSIDVIILGTATPDYVGTPSTACIVQHKLGAKQALAMDISAGCTGFVYGLEVATGLLSLGRGRKRALVIGAELLSRVIDWEDRGTCVLFGDGAGAVVLEVNDAPSEGPERRGLVRSMLWADGSGSESLLFRRGGSRNPFKPGETIEKGICVEMNGQEVYNFAVKAVTDTANALMQADGIGVDDITWIIPHQANARIVQAAARRLKMPAEKIYLNIEEYANTSAASIPIALDELNRNGKIKKGDLILTIGFGGGLTYGGNIIVW
ncbi:MAG: ketoacyl-ACP synthase III [Treponema sp.]|nr:ketoacyl-ACP synthase III [Treponema sp.]